MLRINLLASALFQVYLNNVSDLAAGCGLLASHLGSGVNGGLERRLLVPRPLRLAGQQVRPRHVVAPQRLDRNKTVWISDLF